MDRLACMETILEAGLPLPIKSACFMCPASKPQELIWLHAHHPDLFMTALEIEEISRPRFTTVEGMWRKRSEEHTSELQSLMRNSYAVFCLEKKKNIHNCTSGR